MMLFIQTSMYKHTHIFFKIRDESVRVLLFNLNSRGKKSG